MIMTTYTEEHLRNAMERARIMWERSQSRTGSKRKQAECAALNHALTVLCQLEHPLTIRSAFYRTVSFGAIEKTEPGYKIVDRALVDLRKTGKVPYWQIVDAGRHVDQIASWGSPAARMVSAASTYRRPVWDDQEIDIWFGMEKDAVIGTVKPILREFGIPFTSMKGYSSLSLQWDVAELIRDKPTLFLYLADHDASGENAKDVFERDLRLILDAGRLGSGQIEFKQVAVTPEQITRMGLLTRPPKEGDTRYPKWAARERAAGRDPRAVEVDAIPPKDLRRIVRDVIEGEERFDMDALDATLARQESDRRLLDVTARVPWRDVLWDSDFWATLRRNGDGSTGLGWPRFTSHQAEIRAFRLMLQEQIKREQQDSALGE